eukprot:SAG11_NODE_3816_length_2210_cov_4.887731_2_plen_358_part_00
MIDAKYGLKISDPEQMLGVRRRAFVDENGVRHIEFTQPTFVEEMYGTWKSNRALAGKPFRNYTPQVPFPPDLMLSVAGTDKCPRPCDTEIEETRHDMMSIVGSLFWVARMTQVELAFAAAQIGRVTSASGHEALRAATQMVQYSYSQRDRGIKCRSDGNNKLLTLCDASDKPDPKDGKGTMGTIGFLFDMPIFAKATKTPRVGMSSTHCECMAQTECTKTIVYCHELLKEMGFPECCDEPTPMGNDNWQAVTLVEEDRVTAGNRWYLTEVAYCKEKHSEGYTLPYWVETSHNAADLLTKPLSPQPFLKFRPRATLRLQFHVPLWIIVLNDRSHEDLRRCDVNADPPLLYEDGGCELP